jgi:uncharacterized membrane protein YphA (DoxX/SURF4 family)
MWTSRRPQAFISRGPTRRQPPRHSPHTNTRPPHNPSLLGPAHHAPAFQLPLSPLYSLLSPLSLMPLTRPTPLVPRWPLAVARMYLGLVFGVAGLRQLTDRAPWVKPGQDWATAAHDNLVKWAAHTPGWYHGIVDALLPHAAALAPVAATVHVALGLALVLGAFTRLTSALAFLLLCNYMAAAGTKPYSPGPLAVFAALALAVSLADAGRVWGFDARITRRSSQMVTP